jgi:pantetheine-phosphate adenylyltransferase
MKTAVFAGSFDPITVGHTDIIIRAATLFERIVVAVGTNSQKKYRFDLEQRLQFIQLAFADYGNIETATYTGLTIQFCRSIEAKFLLRGLRTAADFEFERTIAQLNKQLAPEIETVFLVSLPQYSHISSTIVREVLANGGDIAPFVPTEIVPHLCI